MFQDNYHYLVLSLNDAEYLDLVDFLSEQGITEGTDFESNSNRLKQITIEQLKEWEIDIKLKDAFIELMNSVGLIEGYEYKISSYKNSFGVSPEKKLIYAQGSLSLTENIMLQEQELETFDAGDYL